MAENGFNVDATKDKSEEDKTKRSTSAAIQASITLAGSMAVNKFLSLASGGKSEKKGITILNKKGQAIVLLQNSKFNFKVQTNLDVSQPGTMINGTLMNIEEGPLVIPIEVGLEEWEKMKEENRVVADANILSVGFQAIAGPAAPKFSWSIDLVTYNRGGDAGKTFLYKTQNTFDWFSGGYGGGVGLSMGSISYQGVFSAQTITGPGRLFTGGIGAASLSIITGTGYNAVLTGLAKGYGGLTSVKTWTDMLIELK